jgi:hypothetical protein
MNEFTVYHGEYHQQRGCDSHSGRPLAHGWRRSFSGSIGIIYFIIHCIIA